MKKLIITSLISLMALFATAQIVPNNVKVGQQVPDFTVTMLDGSKVKIADLKGKTVLIHFWATWCPPCEAMLKRVQKEIVDAFAKDGLVFIAISKGEDEKTVASFIEKNGYKFNVGLGLDDKTSSLFAEKSIPCNYLIDRNGKVAAVEMGYNQELLEGLINKIKETLKIK